MFSNKRKAAVKALLADLLRSKQVRLIQVEKFDSTTGTRATIAYMRLEGADPDCWMRLDLRYTHRRTYGPTWPDELAKLIGSFTMKEIEESFACLEPADDLNLGTISLQSNVAGHFFDVFWLYDEIEQPRLMMHSTFLLA